MNKDIELIARRLTAFVIDYALVMLIYAIVRYALLFTIERLVPNAAALYTMMYLYGYSMSFILYVLRILLVAIYFTAFEASNKQATPGKRLLGLQVTGNSTKIVPTGSIVVRHVLYYVAISLPSLAIESVAIAMLWRGAWLCSILFTKRRATLYDILSGTIASLNPKKHHK